MKLKTYIAPSMNVAMQKIRDEMGPNAIIVSSSKGISGTIRVTAAIDNAESAFEETKYKTTTQSKFYNQLSKLFEFHKIPVSISNKLLGNLAYSEHEDIKDALKASLAESYKFAPLKFSQSKPLIVVGMPGIGKTLAVSKMATEATFFDRKINIITTDIKRAGGVEQLTAFTKILGINLVVAKNPDELKMALKGKDAEITIIDTAGSNPYDQAELDSTKELLTIADMEPILAIQAGGDVEEARDIAEAFHFVGARRMLITKADSARRLGSIFVALENNGLSFSNFSGTPNVARGLEPVTPESLATLMLRPIS